MQSCRCSVVVVRVHHVRPLSLSIIPRMDVSTVGPSWPLECEERVITTYVLIRRTIFGLIGVTDFAMRRHAAEQQPVMASIYSSFMRTDAMCERYDQPWSQRR